MHLLQASVEPQKISRALLLALVLVLAALNVSAQTTAVTNRALKLDGQGSYVELPPDIFHDLTQATVEAWVKWKEFAWYSRVFEFGAGYQSVSVFNQIGRAHV